MEKQEIIAVAVVGIIAVIALGFIFSRGNLRGELGRARFGSAGGRFELRVAERIRAESAGDDSPSVYDPLFGPNPSLRNIIKNTDTHRLPEDSFIVRLKECKRFSSVRASVGDCLKIRNKLFFKKDVDKTLDNYLKVERFYMRGNAGALDLKSLGSGEILSVPLDIKKVCLSVDMGNEVNQTVNQTTNTTINNTINDTINTTINNTINTTLNNTNTTIGNTTGNGTVNISEPTYRGGSIDINERGPNRAGFAGFSQVCHNEFNCGEGCKRTIEYEGLSVKLMIHPEKGKLRVLHKERVKSKPGK